MRIRLIDFAYSDPNPTQTPKLLNKLFSRKKIKLNLCKQKYKTTETITGILHQFRDAPVLILPDIQPTGYPANQILLDQII